MIIRDWVVTPSWDGSKIEKGLAKLEMAFSKLEKKENKRESKRREKKKLSSLEKEVEILRARSKIQRQTLVTEQLKNRIEQRKLINQERYINNLDRIDRKLARQQSILNNINNPRARAQSVNVQTQRERIRAARGAAVSSFPGSALEVARLNEKLKMYTEQAMMASKATNALSNNLSFTQKIAQGVGNSFQNLARSYVSAFAAMAATVGAYKVGEDLNRIKASLVGVSGTTEGAAQDFDYIKQRALGLGVSLVATAEGYTRVAIAAQTLGIVNKDAKNIFMAAMETSKAFGTDTENTKGIFKAFTDMLSKGTLSMEELRGQLGDRMPIAMAVAAKSFGYSSERISEFVALVSSGKIATKDFIVGFSDELRTFVRDSGMLEASLKTMQTARLRFMTTLQLGIEEGFVAATPSMSEFFSAMSEFMGRNKGLFKVFGKIVGGFFKLLTVGLDTISPVLSVFSTLLIRISKAFDDAFDLDKSSDQIGILSWAIRKLGRALEIVYGLFLIITGTFELWLLEIQESEKGIGGLLDVISLLVGGKMLWWLTKMASKLSIIKGIIGAIAAIIGTVSAAGTAADAATAGAGGASTGGKAKGGMLKKIGTTALKGIPFLGTAIAANEVSGVIGDAMGFGGETILDRLMGVFSSPTNAKTEGNKNVTIEKFTVEASPTMNTEQLATATVNQIKDQFEVE